MGKGIDTTVLAALINKQGKLLQQTIQQMEALTERMKESQQTQKELIKVVAAQNEKIKEMEHKLKWKEM